MAARAEAAIALKMEERIEAPRKMKRLNLMAF
jgi:hypothetical protein